MKLQLAQSVIDEIPPFVHRTGNSLDSLKSRVNEMIIINKPGMHITASGAMVVDLEVSIGQGRPWFAYPRPDDFTVQTADASPMAGRLIGNDEPSTPDAPPQDGSGALTSCGALPGG